MEKNTVLLSIKDYNELRDFKIEIERNHTLHSWEHTWGSGYTWVTTDEAVKCIAQKNKEASKNVRKLQEKIWDLKHPETKKETLESVKKMSIWQFIKWKRNG